MKRIQSIVTAHPRVGTLLSPDGGALRGQLSSLGFIPCDAAETGLDWVVTDGPAAPGGAVPVLRLSGKISIYGLKQAISSLFADQGN